jgi:hypothetical protein
MAHFIMFAPINIWTYYEKKLVVFSIRERHIVMSYVFNFLKQLLHPFIEIKLTVGPTMKKNGCFFLRGRACNCGIHVQFFD